MEGSASKVSATEIRTAVLSNNTRRTEKILKTFGIDGRPDTPFTSNQRRVVSAMFGAALAAAYKGTLKDDFAKFIIKRTSNTTDLFQFLRTIVATTNLATPDYDVIPANVRITIGDGIYSDEVADEISEMDGNALCALVAYLINEIETLSSEYGVPIMWRIYAEKLIPGNLFFAYMGLNLRSTIEEDIFATGGGIIEFIAPSII